MSPDLALSDTEVKICQNYITEYVPKMVSTIFRFPDGIENNGVEICNAFVEAPIC